MEYKMENYINDEEKSIYNNILTLLKRYANIDFSLYKENTIKRRIERRKTIKNIDTLVEYMDLLVTSDEEKSLLCQDILIGVTKFFRDGEAFDCIYNNVLKSLFERKQGEIRIWSVACSTGEEPYSVAILIYEYLEKNNIDINDVNVKIFATDIDKYAISIAQAGMYQKDNLKNIPKEVKEKYFEELETVYKIKSFIRKSVVFAQHNVLNDIPFSKMDLIICRNVFIYIKDEMQKKVLKSFYKVLNPSGYLFIGNSESLGNLVDSFDVVSKKWKIYRKNSVEVPLLNKKNNSNLELNNCYQQTSYDSKLTRKIELVKLLEKILEQVLEPAILINESGEIIEVFNNIQRYISFKNGQFEKNIQFCLNEELNIIINNGIYKLKTNKETRLIQKVRGLKSFENENLSVCLDYLNFNNDNYYLIQITSEKIDINDNDSDIKIQNIDYNEIKDYHIRELQESLNETNQKLQNAIEELEIRNEELQSSNEQMIVSNEELQSANEELQSVNEELYTVNNQYQDKIKELIKSNLDLDNLLSNTEVGALYIDENNSIRRITPLMRRHTNLLSSDIGRQISHIKFMNNYPDFLRDIDFCVKNKTSTEREVLDNNGIRWLVRIKPYYTNSLKIDGILVTMFDITKRIDAAKYELKVLTNNVPGGVAGMCYDDGLIIQYANKGLYNLIGYSEEEFLEKFSNHYERIIVEEDWENVKHSIQKAIIKNEKLHIEYRIYTRTGGTIWRMMDATLIENTDRPVLQCIISDISKLKDTQNNLNSLINNIQGGIMRILYNHNKDVNIIYISDGIFDMIGYTREEFFAEYRRKNKEGLFLFKSNEDKVNQSLENFVDNSSVIKSDYKVKCKDGSYIWIEMRGSVVTRDNNGVVIQYIVTDITEQKNILNDLIKERKKVGIILDISADLIYEYDIKNDTMYYSNNIEDILDVKEDTNKYTKNIAESDVVHKDDYNKLMQFCNEIKNGKTEIHIELRRKYSDGEYHWMEIVGRTIFDEDGKPIKVIGKMSNIDERKDKEEKLKQSSVRDSLTGLYNQINTKKFIKKEMKNMTESDIGYLIVLDVDKFKKINDTMGHLFGDAVLCTFSDNLRNIFKVKLGNGVIGRIGGDEFVVFIKNQNYDEIYKVINKFNNDIKRIYSDVNKDIKISCSAGVSICKKGDSYEEVFKKADSALYYVKNNGRENIQLFDEKICNLNILDVKDDKDNKVIRTEALIKNENDLILFSVELLEKVSNIQTAINLICDRICKFFDFQQVLFYLSEIDDFKFGYHFGNEEIKIQKNHKLFWETIKNNYSNNEIAVLREKDLLKYDLKQAKSVLIVELGSKNEYNNWVVFVDFKNDKDWVKEKSTLKKISSIIFNHFKQVNNNKKSLEQVERLVDYDSVTGLPNYMKFLSLSNKICNDNIDKNYVITYTDMTNFKYLNKLYGYTIGDVVLKNFAEFLEQKAPDVVCCARITSDQFVALHKTDNIENTRIKFNKFLKEFCNNINSKYERCNISLISGISKVNRNKSISENIDNSSMARKSIKSKMETNCIKFTEKMRQDIISDMEITTNMFNAIENEEFKVFLQPKMNSNTETIVGAEALVRWIKNDGTMIYPDKFIPLFERNGFITKVDFYVLENVLKFIRQSIDLGRKIVPISVNFSRRNQENPDFVKNIVELLHKYNVPSEYLEAEITESVFMYDLKSLNENIQKLHNNGIAISIDDFGSGYSSLNVLSRVSVDTIKLDKQFIDSQNILNNKKSSPEFMRLLVMMIKQLGFNIIAEGVETKEQIEFLKSIDCNMVQGYYYSKPVPISEYCKFAEKHQ